METTTRDDEARRGYETLTDADLLHLLETEEDRLPRAAVDEFVRRGERMIEPLTAICRDPEAWQGHLSRWLPIHATLILGAIGGHRALPGLLAALHPSSDVGMDMVLEDRMARLLGAAGPAAIADLQKLVEGGGDIDERPIAAEALGVIAARHPDQRNEILDSLLDVARVDPDDDDDGEGWQDVPVKTAAIRVLLDFARPGDHKALLELADGLEWMSSADDLGPDDVRAAYDRGQPNLDRYLADFLDFYSPGALAERAARDAERAEDERWAQADDAGEAWVEEAVDGMLDAFARSLPTQEEDAKRVAVAVARSMVQYQIRTRHAAPWRWNELIASEYLTHFVHRVAFDERFVRQVPELVLRFVRFLEAEGHLDGTRREEVEQHIADGRRQFVQAALDPENWGTAKTVIAHVAANGAIPSDPDSLEEWMTRLSKRLVAAEKLRAPSRQASTQVPAVGRNDPCPCGSKKKFKKCCGA